MKSYEEKHTRLSSRQSRTPADNSSIRSTYCVRALYIAHTRGRIGEGRVRNLILEEFGDGELTQKIVEAALDLRQRGAPLRPSARA
jgi:hypothetical protein